MFKEIVANILSEDILSKADAICFTSNGNVRKNGELVMGGGVAKSFADKFKNLSVWAGKMVSANGSKTQILYEYNNVAIVAFPTKRNFWENSDLKLIEKSAKELMELINTYNWNSVYLPRPGVGLGKLDWEKQVKPLISQIFDERVYIVSFK